MTITLTTSGSHTHPASDGPRLLLVDDHQLLAETLLVSLTQAGLAASVSPCRSFEDVLVEADAVRPTLVVLDLDLQGAGYGYDLIGPLREFDAQVLVLTGTVDRMELARCLEAGALGIASKANGFGHVLDQICRAANGEAVTPITERTQLLADLASHRRAIEQRRAPFEALSARERDVLRQIVDGRQAAAIAKSSFVSLATVRTQIRSILLKLEVTSQLAAVALARQNGWFEDLAEEQVR